MPVAVAGGGGGLPHLPRNTRELLHILRYAYHQRGTPYSWGGAAPGGFDCSGLVYWAYRKAGYSGIGRTTGEQIGQGRPVGRAHLQPGDIVFPSPHHEGLYIGNGMVLEAPHTGDVVKTIPLSSFGFWQARRLIGGGGGIVPPRGIAGQNHFGLPVGSQNPGDRQPHPNFQAINQQNQAQMQQFMAQQQRLMARNQAQMLTQMKQQAATTRQQNLQDSIRQEAAQRADTGRTAQQNLSGVGLPGVATNNPSSDLLEQRKLKLNDVRAQALQRAGVVV